MDFAWPIAVAVLLLVAGLSALGFDSLRHRRAKKQFDFPELETRLLHEPTGSLLPAPLPPAQTPLASGRRFPRLKRPRLPRMRLPLRRVGAGAVQVPVKLDRSSLYVLGAIGC